MNVLVTGGAGFVGSHFVRALLADRLPGLEGVAVTVLDNLTYAGSFANLSAVTEHPRLDFVAGDVTETALLATVVRRHDAIVHFADSRDHPVTNMVGTHALLDAAHRHGVARFVHISTAEVYGSPPADDDAWPAEPPLAPASVHAATRAGADLLAQAYHRAHGLPVTIVRVTDTYGPRQHPARVVPHAVTALLDGGTVTLDDDRVRDWLHVDDHCRAVGLVLRDGRAGAVYHVGGSVEMGHRFLLELILRECGAGWERVEEVADPPAGDPRYPLDDDLIRRELGWLPRVEFEAGLAATVQWYRQNRDWWRPLLAG